MQAWDVTPNQLSFNTIMDAYAREGNVNNVLKIYNFMQVRRAERSRTAPEREREREREREHGIASCVAGSFSVCDGRVRRLCRSHAPDLLESCWFQVQPRQCSRVVV